MFLVGLVLVLARTGVSPGNAFCVMPAGAGIVNDTSELCCKTQREVRWKPLYLSISRIPRIPAPDTGPERSCSHWLQALNLSVRVTELSRALTSQNKKRIAFTSYTRRCRDSEALVWTFPRILTFRLPRGFQNILRIVTTPRAFRGMENVWPLEV